MRKAFRPFSCAATSEGTSAVGQTKDGSSSVLLRKQNVRLPFIWGKIGYFAHRKNGVDLFYFHVDVPDKNHGSQNTVLCRQLPAVLPDSITGERCGEASAEFSILLPPRRPYLCAAVALLNLLCVPLRLFFSDSKHQPSKGKASPLLAFRADLNSEPSRFRTGRVMRPDLVQRRRVILPLSI